MIVRLAISVEGPTEQEFVRGTPQGHLWDHGIDCRAVIVTTKRLITGPNQKGGSISLERAIREVRPLLSNFDYVTTLYDFYGFRGRKQGQTADDVEREIAERLARPRKLIPYLQMHEFEALLFSSPEHVAAMFSEPDKRRALEEIVRRASGPEKINDDPETAPSKRLGRLFNSYDKKFHGPAIAAQIGLSTMRARCPRFDKWIERLEELGPTRPSGRRRTATFTTRRKRRIRLRDGWTRA